MKIRKLFISLFLCTPGLQSAEMLEDRTRSELSEDAFLQTEDAAHTAVWDPLLHSGRIC